MNLGEPEANTEIRRLRPAEVPALCALSRDIWHAHYPGIISLAQIEYMLAQRYSEAVIHGELRDPAIGWDVLLLNGVISGYTSYFPAESPCLLKIDKLYLHPRAQRRGHGARLLAHVACQAVAHGTTRLTLAVNRHNHAAIMAYHKNGFRIVQSMARGIGMGFEMDDYYMAREIPR